MINLDDLPSYKFSEVQYLPHVSAIYFALAKDNTVLYIGKSKNICKRWRNHHRLYDLEKANCSRVAYLCYDDRFIADMERTAILQFNPLLNSTPVFADNGDCVIDKLKTKLLRYNSKEDTIILQKEMIKLQAKAILKLQRQLLQLQKSA